MFILIVKAHFLRIGMFHLLKFFLLRKEKGKVLSLGTISEFYKTWHEAGKDAHHIGHWLSSPSPWFPSPLS